MTAETSETGGARERLSAWLLISANGDLNGATFDRGLAERRAQATGQVVAELVVVADYRHAAAVNQRSLG